MFEQWRRGLPRGARQQKAEGIRSSGRTGLGESREAAGLDAAVESRVRMKWSEVFGVRRPAGLESWRTQHPRAGAGRIHPPPAPKETRNGWSEPREPEGLEEDLRAQSQELLGGGVT